MIRFIERYFRAGDPRGAIEGLINFGTWEEINYITSASGCVRGNHYHKDTLEAFFILSGRIRIDAQRVENGQLVGEIHHFDAAAGQVFLVQPGTNHTFHVLEASSWMNFLSKKVNASSPDFHRPA